MGRLRAVLVEELQPRRGRMPGDALAAAWSSSARPPVSSALWKALFDAAGLQSDSSRNPMLQCLPVCRSLQAGRLAGTSWRKTTSNQGIRGALSMAKTYSDLIAEVRQVDQDRPLDELKRRLEHEGRR